MDWILTILLLLIGLALIRLTMYSFWLWRTRIVEKAYRSFIKLLSENESIPRDEAAKFEEKIPELKELFERAQIKGLSIPYAEPIGYWRIATGNYDSYDNLSSDKLDIVNWVLNSFPVVRGFYKKGIRDSINPIFWIEILAKLPSKTLVFLGADQNSILAKSANLIYWLFLLGLVVYLGVSGKLQQIKFENWIGEITVTKEVAPEEPNNDLQ